MGDGCLFLLGGGLGVLQLLEIEGWWGPDENQLMGGGVNENVYWWVVFF